MFSKVSRNTVLVNTVGGYVGYDFGSHVELFWLPHNYS